MATQSAGSGGAPRSIIMCVNVVGIVPGMEIGPVFLNSTSLSVCSEFSWATLVTLERSQQSCRWSDSSLGQSWQMLCKSSLVTPTDTNATLRNPLHLASGQNACTARVPRNNVSTKGQ